MPITDFSFHSGIFFTRQTGKLDAQDAYLWAEYASRCVAASKQPVIALVDATTVTQVTAEAQAILAKASNIPGLCMGVVVMHGVVTKNEKTTTVMASKEHTHIFNDMEKGRAFAEQEAKRLCKQYSSDKEQP